MSLWWQMWFRNGFFFRVRKSPPMTGLHGDKKWNDTRVEKTGKGEYDTKDNGWDDEGPDWRD